MMKPVARKWFLVGTLSIMILLVMAPVAFGCGWEPQVVVDNTDMTSNWPETTWSPCYYGTNYQYYVEDGSGTASFTWTPSVPTAGEYEVFARWTEDKSRDSNAPYTIHHAGGDTVVKVNQKAVGGTWVKLGTFEFSAGTDGYVRLSNDGVDDGSVLIADAIGLEPYSPPSEQLLVDNLVAVYDPSLWKAASWAPGFWGNYYQYYVEDGSGPASATWTPTIAVAGEYEVFARWTEDNSRDSNAPYTIHHAGGDTVVKVNQKTVGGTWVKLGTFEFSAGTDGYVRLSNDGVDDGSYLIADAIKLELYTPLVVDNPDATYEPSLWKAANWVPGYWGNYYQYYVVDGVETTTATWTPFVPTAGEYEVFARWTSYPNRANNAPYTIHHAGGDSVVTRNQQIEGGMWVSLGIFDFLGGNDGYIQLSDDDVAVGSYLIADAIKLVLQ